jgi:hypothetical protein
VVPVVVALNVLVEEELMVGDSGGLFVVSELLLDNAVLAAGVPVGRELEVGVSKEVVSDAVAVVYAPGELVADVFVSDEVVPVEFSSEEVGPEDGPVEGDSEIFVSDEAVSVKLGPKVVSSKVEIVVGDPTMVDSEVGPIVGELWVTDID